MIHIVNLTVNSSEHAYQYVKGLFANETELAKIILHQDNAFLAKERAEGITSPPEWHIVKRDIMKCIVREKLRCNPGIAAYLSSIKGKNLVENVRNDTWGIVENGKGGGDNYMVEILVELR